MVEAYGSVSSVLVSSRPLSLWRDGMRKIKTLILLTTVVVLSCSQSTESVVVSHSICNSLAHDQVLTAQADILFAMATHQGFVDNPSWVGPRTGDVEWHRRWTEKYSGIMRILNLLANECKEWAGMKPKIFTKLADGGLLSDEV